MDSFFVESQLDRIGRGEITFDFTEQAGSLGLVGLPFRLEGRPAIRAGAKDTAFVVDWTEVRFFLTAGDWLHGLWSLSGGNAVLVHLIHSTISKPTF
jgi:hypothetical protein